MTFHRLLLATLAVAVLSTVVFFLPVWGMMTLGLLALVAWCCTIPVWIVQDIRQRRQPTRSTVIKHEDGSIEVRP